MFGTTESRFDAINLGGQPLPVQVTVEGDGFHLATVVPEVLAPGTSHEVIIRFHPTMVGAATGSVIFHQGDPGQPLDTVALNGTGEAAPRLQLSPPALSLGIGDDGKIKVEELWITIDAGQVVNPDRVRAQMEGAGIFGISLALHGEITAKGGRIEQGSSELVVKTLGQLESVEAFEKGLLENHPSISSSMLYAWACIKEGIPYANGAPNLSADIPALEQLSREIQRAENITWDEKKKIEGIMERHKEIEEDLKNVAKQLEQSAREMEENRLVTPETIERLQELKRLITKLRG